MDDFIYIYFYYNLPRPCFVFVKRNMRSEVCGSEALVQSVKKCSVTQSDSVCINGHYIIHTVHILCIMYY